MSRIKFNRGFQFYFLNTLRQKLKVDWPELTKTLKVHPRTLSDWRREKYTISEKIFKKCVELTKNKIEIPSYRVLPDFWNINKAAKKGGLALAEKYGGPGTPEGRKRGGLVSQRRRRTHPELYVGCNLRKKILKPRATSEFAELIGIILGDGGINSNYQVVITLHKENDKKYIAFVSNLVKKLFGFSPAIYQYRSLRCKKVVGVTISSVALVEFLLSKGLKTGSKVKHQIDVPGWIKRETKLSKSCLRGLIDTDGGVYYHSHKIHGHQCSNIGLCFTNKSLPLLNFVKNTLLNFGFHPKLSFSGYNIFLYRESEVLRYSQEIGFSNSHHSDRIKIFLDKKIRKGARVV